MTYTSQSKDYGLRRLLSLAMPSAQRSRLSQIGTTLITGGLGSLGMLVALWLAQSNEPARLTLILTGRSGRIANSAAVHRLLSLYQGIVRIHRCDVASSDETSSLRQSCRKV